jgi:Translin-associated factor X-interacting N-terminus
MSTLPVAAAGIATKPADAKSAEAKKSTTGRATSPDNSSDKNSTYKTEPRSHSSVSLPKVMVKLSTNRAVNQEIEQRAVAAAAGDPSQQSKTRSPSRLNRVGVAEIDFQHISNQSRYSAEAHQNVHRPMAEPTGSGPGEEPAFTRLLSRQSIDVLAMKQSGSLTSAIETFLNLHRAPNIVKGGSSGDIVSSTSAKPQASNTLYSFPLDSSVTAATAAAITSRAQMRSLYNSASPRRRTKTPEKTPSPLLESSRGKSSPSPPVLNNSTVRSPRSPRAKQRRAAGTLASQSVVVASSSCAQNASRTQKQQQSRVNDNTKISQLAHLDSWPAGPCSPRAQRNAARVPRAAEDLVDSNNNFAKPRFLIDLEHQLDDALCRLSRQQQTVEKTIADLRKQHKRRSLQQESQTSKQSFTQGSDETNEQFAERLGIHGIAQRDMEDEIRQLRNQVDEARLQVYRQCFQEFVNQFRVYQPLLAQIKREYETTIERQAIRLESLPVIRGQLFTALRQARSLLQQAKLDFSKREAKYQAQLTDTQKELRQLQHKNREMASKGKRAKRDMDVQNAQIAELNETNRTLVQALRRYDSSLVMQEQQQLMDDTEFARMKDKLEQTETEYSQCLSELHELRVQITSMVSSSQHNKIRNDRDRLRSHAASQREAYLSLSQEYQQLGKLYHNLKQNIDPSAVSGSADTGTAAAAAVGPNAATAANSAGIDVGDATTGSGDASLALWKKAVSAGHVPQTPRNELSSLEREDLLLKAVDALMQQIHFLESGQLPDNIQASGEDQDADSKQSLSSSKKSFDGLGMDASVPRFLRYRGKIRNRKLPKRDTEHVIQDVWKKKYRNEDTKKMKIGDFLYQYLKKRFGIQSMIAEWGYNILDAAQRYRYDGDCDLFLRIVNGELPEEVYTNQMMMLETLQEKMVKVDMQVHGAKRKGVVPRKDMLQLLRESFKAKDDMRFSKLKKALYLDAPSAEIKYSKLFEEDRECNQSRFVECIREQHLDEIMEFTNDIAEAIHEEAQGDVISMQQVHSIIQQLDPEKPRCDLEAIVCRGFGVTRFDVLQPEMLVREPDLIQRLKTGLVIRTGPKPLVLE